MPSISVLCKRLREGTITKAEEIELLEKLRETAEEGGAYIRMLLSADTIAWSENQMNQDIFPDLFLALVTAKNHIRELENTALELENANVRIAELEAALETEKTEAHERFAKAAEKHAERYLTLAENHRKHVEELVAAERVIRTIRELAGQAWLEKKSITAEELRNALHTRAPELPEWDSRNPDAYDKV